jgi:hypothetical protein
MGSLQAAANIEGQRAPPPWNPNSIPKVLGSRAEAVRLLPSAWKEMKPRS